VPLLLHVPGLGVHARGTRIVLEVMSVDELTVEASVRPIRVLDAPGANAAVAEEEESEFVESADPSAQSEEEARAEDGEAGGTPNDAADGADSAGGGNDEHVQEGITHPTQVTQ